MTNLIFLVALAVASCRAACDSNKDCASCTADPNLGCIWCSNGSCIGGSNFCLGTGYCSSCDKKECPAAGPAPSPAASASQAGDTTTVAGAVAATTTVTAAAGAASHAALLFLVGGVAALASLA